MSCVEGPCCLFAYSFLLRVPSEALPAIVGCTGAEEGSNAVLEAGEGTFTLHLKRRKNKPEGSCLMRKCCCAKAPKLCIACLLRPLMQATLPGRRVFMGVTAGGAVKALRCMLQAVGTERAQFYRPHDLRRGHAEDLRLEGMFLGLWRLCRLVRLHSPLRGAPLWKILAAGEWRSPAFLDYLDAHRMEIEMVLQGCLDEESDCDDDVHL